MIETTEHALRVLVEERITTLLRVRQMFRKSTYRAEWSQVRRDTDAELRSLVKLLRQARKVAAQAPDEMSNYKSWADWQAAGPVA